MSRWAVHPSAVSAVGRLVAHLQAVFGRRLASVLAYGPWVVESPSAVLPPLDTPINTLALVDELDFADLSACAERAPDWWRRDSPCRCSSRGTSSSRRSMRSHSSSAHIIARHVNLTGTDPFEGMRVRDEDLRRACEVQVRSHLIHLREGFLEAADTAAPWIG